MNLKSVWFKLAQLKLLCLFSIWNANPTSCALQIFQFFPNDVSMKLKAWLLINMQMILKFPIEKRGVFKKVSRCSWESNFPMRLKKCTESSSSMYSPSRVWNSSWKMEIAKLCKVKFLWPNESVYEAGEKSFLKGFFYAQWAE